MTRRDLPNIITVLRILLVGPLVLALLRGRFDLALGLFALAGLSDGLDGLLAKRYGWTSRLGSILDPLADKLMLTATYLALGWLGYLPPWLVGLVIARDVTIIGGAAAYHLFIGRFDMEPTVVSKLNTLLQILLVLAVVFSRGVRPLPDWVPEVLINGVVAATVLSGSHYVAVWGRRAWRSRRGGN